MPHIPHIPVLLDQVLEVFAPLEEGVIVDCTLGFGGHAQALLESKPNIKLIGIDKDPQAREFAIKRLAHFKDRFSCYAGSFGEKFGAILATHGDTIKGVLADIGVSSFQLDSPKRGFGFYCDTLDMRLDPDSSLDAKMIVNRYSAYELQRVFREYGEIREYQKMAALIVDRRQKQPFESAKDLSEFLKGHFKSYKIHPATLAFQAIRIEVNDELGELKSLLKSAQDMQNAIFALISFHSLEDRLVKNALKEWSRDCICDMTAYQCTCGGGHAKGRILTKKPLVPSQTEITHNPRSRSAKLRAFAFGAKSKGNASFQSEGNNKRGGA
ncbi:16S rRNA (cytosine(1402)-N(4))-methyltransferase [Helicobacter sp. 12S02634-8]|uniref:16S rRNA (cytosine(1402)-N(4))-methyltransferase RsmH n=1 Tax=Helicobacter sp. 12S02634-8 TaxID=1476199 RepID=UPI000BA539D2|nr:16S rRNA (cytosine(1402)-N(4))-methyltransferase RsmH [Helicobacter sp. 12S02634-8]PAF47535.1 16S rRNA (cytosine(1402)-N(4))-methyltransferase [Helicobacter sp. 12S02634-8]